MNKIKVYAAEKDIADQIQRQASVAYVAPLTKSIVNEGAKSKLLKILAEHNVVNASVHDSDLYPTQSILVTTSWNKNDDVFGKEQVWPARNTPAHKPTNLNHDEQLIVGHMTDDIYAIDNDGNVIASNSNIVDLPDLFHVVNGAVIYKCWSDEELQKRTAKLIEEIENNDKYVSMECLFTDFDYAISASDGKQHVVARGEETAWLTKHLRAYGGDGVYQDYKVGRYLKNITFVGKGYVDKPANPNSIIFDKNSIPFAKSSEEIHVLDEDGVSMIIAEPINGTATSANKVENLKEKNKMPDDNKQVETLQATIADLQRQLAEVDTKKLESRIEELQIEMQADKDALAEAGKSKEADAVQLKELQAKLDEKVEAYDKLQSQIDDMEAAKIVANRITSLVEGGFDKEAAEIKVTLFANLSDEQFNAVAEELIEAKKACKTDNKESKEDEASEADEVTNEETDESDAQATDEVLESAEASEGVEITGGSDNTEEDDLRKDLTAAIAETFGIKTKKESE